MRKTIRKNKRADITIGLKELVELVLAALVIIFGWLLINNAYSHFGADDITESSTLNNFDRLHKTIQGMLDSDDPFIKGTIPIYISKEHNMIAFDSDWTRIKADGAGKNVQWDINEQGVVYRPKVCGDNACLCLYKGKVHVRDLEDENLIVCKIFETGKSKGVTFVSPYTRFGRPRWNSLVRPGFCGEKRDDIVYNVGIDIIDDMEYGYYAIMGEGCSEWAAQQIYIEKMDLDRYSNDPTGKRYFFSAIASEETANRSLQLLPIISSPVYHLGEGERLTPAGVITKWGALIDGKIAAIATAHPALTKSLAVGVISAESSGDETNVGYNGVAAGLWMFTIPTANDYAEPAYPGSFRAGNFVACGCGVSTCGQYENPKCTPSNDDRMNAAMATTAGTNYVHKLITRYDAYTDKQKFAIAAYNAGPGNIDTAIKNAKTTYSTQNPSWGQVAAVIPQHLPWGKEVVKHIPRVFAYKEEADRILGT